MDASAQVAKFALHLVSLCLSYPKVMFGWFLTRGWFLLLFFYFGVWFEWSCQAERYTARVYVNLVRRVSDTTVLYVNGLSLCVCVCMCVCACVLPWVVGSTRVLRLKVRAWC
eukprot:EC716014.1.p1 GENE.EC716014.1~~EC716014.1.p1  ORF type:complete len:112 (+),score=1.14 EC716014.1:173-508(+)